MKNLFAKKWHSIPVAVVSAVVLVCLLAGSAFAAYSFSNVNVNMEVREPMEITMDLGWDSPDAGPIAIAGTVNLDDACTAGDIGYIALVIKNKSSGDITVATVLGGSHGYFDFTGLPNGVITAGATWSGTVTVKVRNDAPPGTYGYTITFNRS